MNSGIAAKTLVASATTTAKESSIASGAGTAGVAGKGAGGEQRRPGARRALLTLACINLLNLADRYVLSAVKDALKEDLRLTDAETALPMAGTALVIVVFSCIFGYFADADSVDRTRIVAAGVALWSLATALAGLAQDLWHLVLFRALVGVGEASYAVISGPMISDFFPRHERTMALAIFNLSTPAGGALGFAAGAALASSFGWRAAFALVGGPGLIAALFALRLEDPPRGGSEGLGESDCSQSRGAADSTALLALGKAGAEPCGVPSSGDAFGALGSGVSGACEARSFPIAPGIADGGDNGADCGSHGGGGGGGGGGCWMIATNPHWLVATFSQVAVSFSIGGLADWGSSFLQRYDGASMASAGLMIGLVTAGSGILGNLLGAKTAEFLEPRVRSAGFLTPALFSVPAATLTMAALNIAETATSAYMLLFFAQVFLWTYMAPIGNISLSVLPADLRARGSAMQIVVCHVLGDVISPPIVGAISDRTGSLRMGMQLTWIAMLVAGVWWFVGFACLSPVSLGHHCVEVACHADIDEEESRLGRRHRSAEPRQASFWSLLFASGDEDQPYTHFPTIAEGAEGAGGAGGAGAGAVTASPSVLGRDLSAGEE